MCNQPWEYIWAMLMAACHYLGRLPTETRRKNMVRLFMEVGKTLACAQCRQDWATMVNGFAAKRVNNIYVYTTTTQSFFTLVFDAHVGWNFAHGILMPYCWEEASKTFQIANRQPDNLLVALYPNLYNIPATAKIAPPPKECGLEVCQCTICTTLNWGPYFWTYLHTLASQEHLFSTINNTWVWKHVNFVAACVPCGDCYMHWQTAIHNVKKYAPGVTASRLACFTFLFDLHNVWNAKLNKKQHAWELALQTYRWDVTTPYDNLVWKQLGRKRWC